ncbi:restriction endonuclease subunit S [Campylobacter majalis]|uniref:restriction endonuclease subunit S n=1 Tax=Campylobacter majalis TaxID=2790656 RepID=UPI001E451B01|nr:restriction endonuclease subunit S [Campylobacter majalis]
MVITPLKDEILKKFLVFILPFANIKQVITGSAQPQITRTNLSQLQIPLPPLIIQKQIVKECEKVEKEYQKIRMSIEEYRNLIKAVLEKCGVGYSQAT